MIDKLIFRAFVLQQIHLQQGNFKLAEQSLEVGLSYNFEVSRSFREVYKNELILNARFFVGALTQDEELFFLFLNLHTVHRNSTIGNDNNQV